MKRQGVPPIPMKVNILNTISRIERTVEIPGDEILIGSDIECDIVLEGDGIEGQHLRLAEIRGNFFSKTYRDEYNEISSIYPPANGLLRGEPDLKDLNKLTGPIVMGHYTLFHLNGHR